MTFGKSCIKTISIPNWFKVISFMQYHTNISLSSPIYLNAVTAFMQWYLTITGKKELLIRAFQFPTRTSEPTTWAHPAKLRSPANDFFLEVSRTVGSVTCQSVANFQIQLDHTCISSDNCNLRFKVSGKKYYSLLTELSVS